MHRQRLACPGCHCVDQVRNISGLVHGERATIRGTGRATGRFGGWYGGQLGGFGGSFSAVTEGHAEHATALSEMLAPPSAPLYVNRWGVVSRALLVLGVLAGLLALLTVPDLHCAYDPPNAPTHTVCQEGQGSMLLEMRAGVMPDPEMLTRVVDGGLIALPVGLLSGLVIVRAIVSRRRRSRFHSAYQAWQRAYERWQHLFYCLRCDGVFDPATALFLTPADEMADLLFSAYD